MAYGWASTTDEVLEGRDLSGQRILITGGSAGLGVETARALAAHGASVVLAVRDLAKGEGAAKVVRAGAAPGTSVDLCALDLASLASVRACVDRLLAEGKPLTVLIANAGVMACPQGTTADGFETQFGTNHLGHFVFVNRLVPLLVAGAQAGPKGAPSRIVVLSSSGHRMSDVDLNDPGFERTPYDPWTAYGRAKTANALFAIALDARLRDRGVRACAVHPGGIQTELGRHLTPDTMRALMERFPRRDPFTFKTVPQGAATSVWAAVVADPAETGGRYCEDCGVAPIADTEEFAAGVRPYAQDAAHAAARWARRAVLVGERFPLGCAAVWFPQRLRAQAPFDATCVLFSPLGERMITVMEAGNGIAAEAKAEIAKGLDDTGGANIALTIKNYRCFGDSDPVRLSIRPGFTGLVGANNAGKSSLLRFFFEFRNLFVGCLNLQTLLQMINSGEGAFSFPSSVMDQTEVFCNQNRRPLVIEIDVRRLMDGTHPPNGSIRRCVFEVPWGSNRFTGKLFDHTGMLQDGKYALQAETVRDASGRTHEPGPLLMAFALLGSSLYLPSFRNVINIGANDSYYDIKTGNALIADWNTLKTGKSKQRAQMASRIVQDIARIFGYRTLEINTSQEAQTLQVVADGHPYMLAELGSGLAQFLIAFMNVASQRRSVILVDEPEQNLHPALQSEFLLALGLHAEFCVMFATHSIGLARRSSERVYSVRRSGALSSVRPYESTENLIEFVGELSYSQFRDLGFETVLLVEGPTEMRTMQQFLRMANKDHKVVTVPLAGNSLIKDGVEHELRELTRLSDRVVALIDSERSEKGPESEERQAFARICDSVGIGCHVLELRAIENYLTQEAIRIVKSEKYRALLPFERLADAEPSWDKSENWRIAREMSWSDIADTDLGKFLARI